MDSKHPTEWEGVDKWYDQIVGKEGHYYHRNIILPKLLECLDLKNFDSPSLLDLACGQGILASHVPSHVTYTGIDLAPSLVAAAKKKGRPNQNFLVADICKTLPLKKKDYSHATIILALQNVAHPDRALMHAAQHLVSGGILAIVLNHPCFRIPRQASWMIDEKKKQQCRRVDAYLSPMKIPIVMHPGKGAASQTTWSFHHPLSDYSQFLAQAGFAIMFIEEWTSDKKSTGRNARMENRAREEFPLFLTFIAKKIF
jgi:ubiquinone/menaquinone biosynthesis C-methylase UbiE